MKRKIIIIVSILFIITFTTGAVAEKPLSELCDSVFDLLFSTNNVTLMGEATFSLDGNRFKTAEAKYIQDGDRSYWDLKLSSPRTDGTIRENGYTVIADGSKIYVMEVFRPGIYKTGTGAPQSTILRESVQMEVMKKLIRSLAEETEADKNQKNIIIEKNDSERSLRIAMDEPANWFNMSLNILAEYAAKRYFHMNYDQIAVPDMVPMSYYLTVTEGILACTTSVSLKQADVTIREDTEGQIESITGKACLMLNTARDGNRTLDISFTLTISDRGMSHVGTFSPGDYNVKLVEGGMNIEDIEYSEVDFFTQERLIEQARKAWEQAGYILDSSAFGYCYKQNGRYCTELNDASENLFLSCVTNVNGKVLELRNMQNTWQGKNFNYDNAYPDMQLAEEAGRKVMEYLKEANPEDVKRVDHLKLQCWYEEGGELYFEFCEDPLAQDWDGFLVVVKVKPDWQLMYYSCFSNG